jgi:hypothetical protein
LLAISESIMMMTEQLFIYIFKDDWDSDFDDESVSQVGGPGAAPATGQNAYAQQQVH